ncbi:MAG: hypothetical protein QG657_2618, partial [Acidobacteriota bacterium]|nr:hypothetical protein [Acidobacteriota bacterium]
MKMKAMKKSNLLMYVLLTFFLMAPLYPVQGLAQDAAAPAPQLLPDQVEKIEAFIKKQMTAGNIPGMSVVIVMGDQTVYEKGFGFTDLEKKTPV